MTDAVKAQLRAVGIVVPAAKGNTPAPAPAPRTSSATATETARKKPRQLEASLQEACVKWFRLQYSPLASLLFAIPNGGSRNPREGARLKAQGVTAGVPDLLLAKPRYDEAGHVVCAGLWLELKVGKNKPSPEQCQIMTLLAANGYRVVVVFTFEEFQAVIQTHIGY